MLELSLFYLILTQACVDVELYIFSVLPLNLESVSSRCEHQPLSLTFIQDQEPEENNHSTCLWEPSVLSDGIFQTNWNDKNASKNWIMLLSKMGLDHIF